MGMGLVWFLALYGLTGYSFGLDIGLLVAAGFWGIWVVGKEIREARKAAE
jgi:hypothetical protein